MPVPEVHCKEVLGRSSWPMQMPRTSTWAWALLLAALSGPPPVHLPYGSIWDVTYEQVTSDCRIGRGEPAGHFAKTWRLQLKSWKVEVARLCKPPHVMRMRKAVSGMEFAQICSLLLRSHLTREIELIWINDVAKKYDHRFRTSYLFRPCVHCFLHFKGAVCPGKRTWIPLLAAQLAINQGHLVPRGWIGQVRESQGITAYHYL